MKKIVSALCVALLAFLFVACSSNPGIKAGKVFLDNPTIENFKKYTAEVAYLEDDEMAELEEWTEKRKEKLEQAVTQMLTEE